MAVLTVALVVGLGVAPGPLGPSPAAAAPGAPGLPLQPPEEPDTPEEAAAALEVVQREAEALTEEWHAAQDALAASQEEQVALEGAVEPARRAADEARAAEEAYRAEVDALVMAIIESGNLDQLDALVASGSPQDFLDQMSALEILAADQRVVLDDLRDRIAATDAAVAEADAAVVRARAATEAAAAAELEVGERQRAAELRIDEAQELLDRLTPELRTARAGSASGPDGPVAGSGVGVEALNFAISQLGKPYRYGAEGPNNYDCSGLTSWAFAQAGVTLPRSSSQQATVGRSVPRSEIRAGDLIFFYSPVSHVGIAVDNDTMIHSPQTGDVVKYSSIAGREFHSARRL